MMWIRVIAFCALFAAARASNGMDLRVNVFASSGDLNQISYANKAVEKGSTTVIVARDDSVLVITAPGDSSPFLVRPPARVARIDECLHCVCVGYKPDIAFVHRGLIDSAQKHRTLFDERIPLPGIAQDAADRMCAFMKLREKQEEGKRGFYSYVGAGLGEYEAEDGLGMNTDDDESEEVVGRPLAVGLFLVDTLTDAPPRIARVLNAGQVDLLQAAVLGEGAAAFQDALNHDDAATRNRQALNMFRKLAIRPRVFRIRGDKAEEIPDLDNV